MHAHKIQVLQSDSSLAKLIMVINTHYNMSIVNNSYVAKLVSQLTMVLGGEIARGSATYDSSPDVITRSKEVRLHNDWQELQPIRAESQFWPCPDFAARHRLEKALVIFIANKNVLHKLLNCLTKTANQACLNVKYYIGS